MFPLSGRLFQYQESQIQIPLGPDLLCGIPRDILEKGLKQEQVTIKHYRERMRQAECSDEFALSEALGILSHKNKITKWI